MAKEYLDKDGLAYFWTKIKSYIAQQGGGGLTIDDIYPVGSIYTSVNSTNPGTLFAGTTWQPIEDTFLLAAGTNHSAGSTGGSEDAVVPYHRHSVSITSGAGTSHHHGAGTLEGSTPKLTANLSTFVRSSTAMSSYRGTITSSSSANFDYLRQATGGTIGRGAPEIDAGKTVDISGNTGNESAHTHSVSGNTGYAGTNGNENGANMPPFLAVYVWKRTA